MRTGILKKEKQIKRTRRNQFGLQTRDHGQNFHVWIPKVFFYFFGFVIFGIHIINLTEQYKFILCANYINNVEQISSVNTRVKRKQIYPLQGE